MAIGGGGLEGLTNSAIQDLVDSAISDALDAQQKFQFGPLNLLNPVNSDWAVNALAPAAADGINPGLTVRLFDDTIEEGIGFILRVPATATSVDFSLVHRAVSPDPADRNIGLNVYQRGIADNVAVESWSAGTQIADVIVPNNTNFQDDTQTVTLASLGVTAGEVTQFEITRDAPLAGTDLVGDWSLLHLIVSFS